MRPFPPSLLAATLFALGGASALPHAARADGPPRQLVIEYENLTKGQGLSTSAFVAHRHGVHLWVAGQPADLSLRMLAEEGNPEWILGTAVADEGKQYGDAAAAIPELPGQKRHVTITVDPAHPELSGAIMLGQTNDGFVGVDAVPVYGLDKPLTIDLFALDAGTAVNNEDKSNLRAFGGLGRQDEAGVVGPHPGLRANSEVPLDWRFDPRQPVARVTITPLAAPNG